MNQLLHQDPELFKDLLQVSSERLSIPTYLVEKDYYISMILKALSLSVYKDQIVFKGGTSLSKAYQLIDRFSEDVDFAVISEGMSGNQVKTLLSHLIKEVTAGLSEDKDFVDVSKGSKYRKQAFTYTSQLDGTGLANPIPARVIVEISAFANPFPYEKSTVLKEQGMIDFMDKYDLGAFELNVLSLTQTLCEKLVSLIRFSMSADPITALSSKIRHFYDIEALLHREDLLRYIEGTSFLEDIQRLIRHDQTAFSEPQGWGELTSIKDAPVIKDFDTMWNKKLGAEYERNLSLIAYKSIPSRQKVEQTFMGLIDRLKSVAIR